ncbi:MAG TPA: hypothetical protein VM074_04165 [Solimonas sp.]|nr:hypothetical protein [Solimonas sp.]
MKLLNTDKLAGREQLDELGQRLLLLNGRSACWQQPRGRNVGCLAEVEFRVFSQWGEDGIIEWLVAHLDLPNTRFVEFGVESFREANCRFLLMNRNWKGLVMDGSAEHMASLRKEQLFWKHDLTAHAAFITAENIDGLLRERGFAGPLGLLSIDIDGNDYWVWQAITAVNPAIVVCEYNPVLGDTAPLVVPYDPAFTRFKAHHSGLYFGASIAALRLLAGQRGYEFVGTSSSGINAFFVRSDLAGPVLKLLGAARAFPSRHRDSRDSSGQLSFTGGVQRFELIRELPAIDVASGARIKLGDIGQPYSAEWLAQM